MSYKTNAIKTSARGFRVIDFADGGRVEVHFPSYTLKGEAAVVQGWQRSALQCVGGRCLDCINVVHVQ